MEGNIYISGLIGSLETEKGVELIDVITQVKKQPTATSYNVHINSEGGVVDTGFDIYNYLKNLGLPIKTIGSGLVASIATVIFMAGNERILRNGTQFMVHLPMGGITNGTADEIEDYARETRQVEDRIVKFYSDLTNVDKETIKALLRNETWLDTSKALELGFTTNQDLPMVAKAYFKNTNTNTNMTKEDKSWIEQKFDALLNMIKSPVKNIVVQDANGRSVDFPDIEEGQDIVVGSKATIDGTPAEGDVVMPDGRTFVFAGGELVEIREAEVEDDMEAKYNELKEKYDALTNEKAEVENKLVESETAITNLRNEVVAFKKQVTSKFEGEFKKDPKKVDEPKTASFKDGIQKLREKRKTI